MKPSESRKHDSKERTLTQMEQAVLQHESTRTTTEPGRLGSTDCYHLPYTTGFASSDFDHFPRLNESFTGQFYVRQLSSCGSAIKIRSSLVTVS